MEKIPNSHMKVDHKLQLCDITVHFPNRTLFEKVSLSVQAGKMTSLQGRNGTGKSTLLRCIAGLTVPNEGRILLDNKPIASMSVLERSRVIGALWTDRVRLAGITLRELVEMGTYNSIHTGKTEIARITDECMIALHIEELANQTLDRLSDGELQKGMIARALAQRPAFLLLDEPTTFLDYVAKDELMITLQQVCASSGVGVLFTSHDLDIIHKYAEFKFELSNAGITQLN
jgi:iron complex transport system ATP-binding protein